MDDSDLDVLLGDMRALGVDIGVDDHLRCRRLLRARANWTREALRSSLRALLGRGGRALEAFDAAWSAIERAPTSDREPALAQPAERTANETSAPPNHRRWAIVGLVLGLAVGLPAGAGMLAATADLSSHP